MATIPNNRDITNFIGSGINKPMGQQVYPNSYMAGTGQGTIPLGQQPGQFTGGVMPQEHSIAAPLAPFMGGVMSQEQQPMAGLTGQQIGPIMGGETPVAANSQSSMFSSPYAAMDRPASMMRGLFGGGMPGRMIGAMPRLFGGMFRR